MKNLRREFRIAALLAALFILWVAVGLVLWPRVDPAPAIPPEAVIALSSNAATDTTLDDAGTKRLVAAIAEAKKSGARLFTTRAHHKGHFSDGGQRRLIAAGGLIDRWSILPGIPRTTHDEALELRAAVSGPTRVAVVTSPLHTRRACAIFEHVGFRVTCVASRQSRWWLVAYEFVYEQLAMIKARLNGWI